jgi:hypothetical protein
LDSYGITVLNKGKYVDPNCKLDIENIDTLADLLRHHNFLETYGLEEYGNRVMYSPLEKAHKTIVTPCKKVKGKFIITRGIHTSYFSPLKDKTSCDDPSKYTHIWYVKIKDRIPLSDPCDDSPPVLISTTFLSSSDIPDNVCDIMDTNLSKFQTSESVALPVFIHAYNTPDHLSYRVYSIVYKGMYIEDSTKTYEYKYLTETFVVYKDRSFYREY